MRPNSGRSGGCISSTALVTFLFNACSSAGCACACIKLRSAGVVSASACSRQNNRGQGESPQAFWPTANQEGAARPLGKTSNTHKSAAAVYTQPRSAPWKNSMSQPKRFLLKLVPVRRALNTSAISITTLCGWTRQAAPSAKAKVHERVYQFCTLQSMQFVPWKGVPNRYTDSSDALILMLPGALWSEHGQPGSHEASGCMVK